MSEPEKVMQDVDDDIEEEFDEDEGPAADPDDEVGKEKDITDDGGLKKKIVKVGQGWATPKSGAEVTVHYTGTLEDGTKFDSSRDRDEPFTFKIGEGQVIKGWDKGVAAMKKGERSILTCRSDYAYGDSGSPPKIPGGATLNFDVELISWTEWKDITSNKNGTIMKKVIKEGDGWEQPNFDSVVTVSWKLRLDEEGKVLEEVENRKVTIGAEETVLGLDFAMEKAKKGEQAIVCLTPAVAFGEKGDDKLGVPANSNVYYEYTVHDFEKTKDSWALKGKEKIDYAEVKKTDGSTLFKEGKVERAIRKYELALSYVQSIHDMDENDKPSAAKLANLCRLNLAACALKKCDWNEVISKCSEVLKEDQQNGKALLRRGKAYNELNLWDESKSDLTTVIDLNCAETTDAKKEYSKLQKKISAQNAKDKKAFANMFTKIRDPEPPAPPKPTEKAEAKPAADAPKEEEKKE